MYDIRYIHWINTNDLKLAKKLVPTNLQLVVIDMTIDYNQNRWLGQEINHLLLFFDRRTRLNGLLSVLACVKGGGHIFLAYDECQPMGFFKKNILIPKLKSLAAITNKNKKKSFEYNNQRFSHNIDLSIIEQLIDQDVVKHLIGARGTGKSTLLGETINRLIKNGIDNVLLVAQYPASTRNTLSCLTEVSRETLNYALPQELKEIIDNYDVVIIDEVAIIQIKIIEMAIEWAKTHNKKLILSTTIEGYEGTGQNYRLKYINDPLSNIIKLKGSKRFSDNDPLHQWSTSLCHRKMSVLSIPDGVYCHNHQSLRQANLTPDTFTLLQQAHYKTTPNDLERFYDDDALFVIVIKNKQMVGALHAFSEILPDDISIADIYRGKRRVKNAMTQQSLIIAYGKYNMAKKHILRVGRIATNEAYRRQGIASKMILSLVNHIQSKKYDFISTSLTIKQSSVLFWEAMNFQVVRIGLHKNKWDDQYSVLMLLGLNFQSELLIQQLQEKYYRHLHYYQPQLNDDNTLRILYRHLPDKTTTVFDNEMLLETINATSEHYRDIHWLLPELANYVENGSHKKKLELIDWFLTGKTLNKNEISLAKEDLREWQKYLLK